MQLASPQLLHLASLISLLALDPDPALAGLAWLGRKDLAPFAGEPKASVGFGCEPGEHLSQHLAALKIA